MQSFPKHGHDPHGAKPQGPLPKAARNRRGGLFRWGRAPALAVVLGISVGFPSNGEAQTPVQRPAAEPTRGTRPQQFVLRDRNFDLPCSVAKLGRPPREIQLYVSRDGGKNWQLDQRQPPRAGSFPFSAPGDGHYWFSTRTIAANGASIEVQALQPHMKITVDTSNPELEAKITADGNGQLILDYTIRDTTIRGTRLRVEYQTDTVQQMMPVSGVSKPVERIEGDTLEGRMVWVPQTEWRHAFVRIVAQDEAGNQTVLTRQVQKPRIAEREPRAQVAAARMTPPADLTQPRAAPQNQPPVYSNPKAVPARPASGRTGGPLTGPPPANRATTPTTGQAFTAPYNPRPQPTPTQQPMASTVPSRPAQSPPPGNPAGPRVAVSNGDGLTLNPPTSQQAPTADQSRIGHAAPQTQVPPDRAPTTTQATPPVSQRPEDALRPIEAQAERPANAPPAAMTGPEEIPAPVAQPDTYTKFGPQNAQPQNIEANRPNLDAANPAESRSPLRPAGPNDSSGTDEPIDGFDRGSANAWPQPTPPAPGQAAPPRDEGSATSEAIESRLLQAPLHHSPSRSFTLPYELESISRQGIDRAELWCTKDRGASWKYWDSDQDRQSPFDVATAGEGLYGFRIVVVDGNGLAQDRPQDGDEADLYVFVDTQPPTARITAARYGDRDDVGKLLIEYRCEDELNNLAPRPITLKFAESPEGPWTTIATGLHNDGFYAWAADPQLPRRVYLRVEAVDQAGNVGGETLDQPIALQGLAPRGRIRGFQIIPDQAGTPPDRRSRQAMTPRAPAR